MHSSSFLLSNAWNRPWFGSARKLSEHRHPQLGGSHNKRLKPLEDEDDDEDANDSNPSASIRIYRQKFLVVANDELGYCVSRNFADISVKVIRYISSVHGKPLF